MVHGDRWQVVGQYTGVYRNLVSLLLEDWCEYFIGEAAKQLSQFLDYKISILASGEEIRTRETVKYYRLQYL